MVDVIFPIVEGHGEVAAVPELLRRLAHERFQNYQLHVMSPFRIPKNKLVVAQDLRKVVDFGVRKLSAHGGIGAILVLLDADDDCPATLAPRLLQEIANVRKDLLSSVVVAKKEYECWFLASAMALRGRGMIKADAVPPPQPEAIRDAKGYLERECLIPGHKYSETVDQVALTAMIDFDEAMSCPSFRKLYRDMEQIFNV